MKNSKAAKMENSKLNVGNIIIALFFFGILFGSLIISTIMPEKKISVIENRDLAQKPIFTSESFLNGTYFDKYEAYHSDQYPLRNKMLEVNGLFKYKVINQKVADVAGSKYYRSNDGFIINQVVPLSPIKLINELDGFTKESTKLGIDVFFSIIPHKTVVFENELPNYLPSYGRENLKVLKTALNTVPSLHLIDVSKEISKVPKEEIYFRNDHHWNTNGAFIGYQKIISEMNNVFPVIGEPIQKESYKFKQQSKDFYGSYARSTTLSFVSQPDHMIIPTNNIISKNIHSCNSKNICEGPVFADDALTDSNLYMNRYEYFGQNKLLTKYKNDHPISNKTLVVIKDSYALPTIPFLAQHFKELYVIDTRYFATSANYKNSSAFEMVKNFKPDAVCFIINSSAISSNITDYIK
ncbi:DHHW family protein [Bacillus sp. AFS041924]|uniref:DHHW family protein n=1 Tax=Bacillus sp. AFS041924 TaxID=2033503 RepID=UPI001145E006|nr:DHHW family protein [Bacillus sp. AFS041924]